LQIINRSGQTLTLGQDDHWVEFTIVGDDGSIADKVADVPVKGEFTLASGQSGTRTLNLTPYYDFRRPGHYRISGVVHLEQWHQDVACRSVGFFVAEGVALPNLGNLPVGVPPPPGVTNMPPVVRYYSLLKVGYRSKATDQDDISSQDELMLYFRLTDANGRTLRVYPLARLLSFSTPEAQLDRSNDLHVLFQTGARSFSYFIMDPEGRMLARQVHEYAGASRPHLAATDDGVIFVRGGFRRYTEADWPPIARSK
jgi:hypothetical protein